MSFAALPGRDIGSWFVVLEKTEGERERERKNTSAIAAVVALFLKGQLYQIIDLPPLGDGAETMWNLANPFFFFFFFFIAIIIYFLSFFLSFFLKKSRVINTPLPALPADTLNPLTNLVSL